MIKDTFNGLQNLFNGFAKSRSSAYAASSGVMSSGQTAGPTIPLLVSVMPDGRPNTDNSLGYANINFKNVLGSFQR